MGLNRGLNITIVDTPFNPIGNRNVIERSYNINKTPHYHIWMYLEGVDLIYVKKVTYVLHSSFRNNVREIYNTPQTPNFMLDFWTWGIFQVLIIIEDKFGDTHQYNHRLTYDQYFRRIGYKINDVQTNVLN